MVKNKLYVSGDEDKYKYYRNKICRQCLDKIFNHSISFMENDR